MNSHKKGSGRKSLKMQGFREKKALAMSLKEGQGMDDLMNSILFIQCGLKKVAI